MKKEIFIIDDEEVNLELLASILKSSYLLNGYEIKTFTSALVAYEYCKNNLNLDVVLLDLNMSDISGIEFLEKFNEETPDYLSRPSFIVISMIDDQNIVQRCFDLGVDEFYIKPFDEKTVLSRINSVVNKRKLVNELRSTLQYKKILLRTLLHDISSPLTRLNFYIRHVSPEGISNMESAIQQMIGLLDSIKNLEAFESGKIVDFKEPFNFKGAMEEAVKSFADIAAKKKIEINLSIGPNVPSQLISVRSIFVHQILGNLISNAIKFTEAGGTVFIICDKRDGFVEVRVRDCGIGIPDYIKEKFFFWDAKTSRLGTEKEKGTGFGLPILKKFVDDLNYTIDVYSPVVETNGRKHGSEFVIKLSDSEYAP